MNINSDQQYERPVQLLQELVVSYPNLLHADVET